MKMRLAIVKSTSNKGSCNSLSDRKIHIPANTVWLSIGVGKNNHVYHAVFCFLIILNYVLPVLNYNLLSVIQWNIS